MTKLFKWLLPILIVTEVLLVWTGVLDGQTAVVVVGVVEVLAFLVGLRQVVAAVLRYRRNRAAGLDLDSALEDGLSIIFPRPVARLVALEPRLWVCLLRWIFRRRPLAANEFGYSKRSIMGSMLLIIMLSAPAEILVFELLVPWDWLRWVLLIGSIYSVIWFLGFFASLKVLPYRLTSDDLRVYFGVMADGTIPYHLISAVTPERRKAPTNDGLKAVPAEDAIYIACGQRTDLTLHLAAPVVIRGLTKDTPPASTLYLAADDPAQLTAALQQRLATNLVVA